MHAASITLPTSGHPDVRLRWLTRDDAPAWFRIISQPEVRAQTSWSASSPGDLDAIFDALVPGAPSPELRIAIVGKDNALLGTVGFHSLNVRHASAELAYELSFEVWGRGIATAVARQVTAWGLQQFGWQRIQATVLDTNSASARVLLKCGFTLEGRLRNLRRVGGASRDFDVYSLVPA